MSELTAARSQMGTSLAFHIVFAALGIGLPLLAFITEGLWLCTHNEAYLRLAKKWAQATAILFAVGAVSGTILSFELGLLWPGFMAYAGSIIGMPFSMEGFAFFTEAIFLALYLYGWKRLSPKAHWLTTIPVTLSSILSSVFVVAANGWMNSPAGFKIVDGKVSDVDPVAALFNPAWGIEALHSTMAAVVAAAFAIAGVYAFGMLRGRRDAYHKRGLVIPLLLGCILMPVQFVTGDMSARWVAENQPAKLAAMEGQFQTEQCAPLRIGGLPDPQTHTTNYALDIPCGLSFLAFGDTNATVQGLDSIPADSRPNPLLVHPAFQIMVGAGTALLILAGWVGVWWWRKRRTPDSKWLLRSIVVGAPLGFVALEAGWTVTEEGRQPWVVYSILRTSAAVTPTPGLVPTFYAFSVIYLLLAVAVVWLLRRLANSNSLHDHDYEIPTALNATSPSVELEAAAIKATALVEAGDSKGADTHVA
jgi:cytochrome d ubiquinol oxidase subunit I